jgi:hypothetical protein
LPTFKIGSVNGREARESGIRLKASVARRAVVGLIGATNRLTKSVRLEPLAELSRPGDLMVSRC